MVFSNSIYAKYRHEQSVSVNKGEKMRRKILNHHKHPSNAKGMIYEHRQPLFRKAQMMMGGRKIMSIIVGLILVVLGVIPLLNALKVISFSIPTLPEFILWTAGMVGAFVLIADALQEMQEFGFGKIIMVLSFVIALVIFLYGANSFNILPFPLPALGVMFVNAILVVAGILLIIGGFIGF